MPYWVHSITRYNVYKHWTVCVRENKRMNHINSVECVCSWAARMTADCDCGTSRQEVASEKSRLHPLWARCAAGWVHGRAPYIHVPKMATDLSICLSVWLSVWLPVCLSFSVCSQSIILSLSLAVFQFVCLSLFIHVSSCLYVCLHICLSVCLSVDVYLSAILSTFCLSSLLSLDLKVSVCLSVGLFVSVFPLVGQSFCRLVGLSVFCLSVFLSIGLFICLCLSICLSIGRSVCFGPSVPLV